MPIGQYSKPNTLSCWVNDILFIFLLVCTKIDIKIQFRKLLPPFCHFSSQLKALCPYPSPHLLIPRIILSFLRAPIRVLVSPVSLVSLFHPETGETDETDKKRIRDIESRRDKSLINSAKNSSKSLPNQTKTPTFVQTNQFRHLLSPIETVTRHGRINEVVQTSIIRKQAKTSKLKNMKKKKITEKQQH